MQLFPDYPTFESVLGGVTKWQRTLQALRDGGPLPEVAYSIGDSLSYRRTRTAALATPHFIGRRRYHLVLAPLSATAHFEVADNLSVTPITPYSDITGQQWFTGTGQTVAVPKGAVLIADIAETVRPHPDPDVDVMVLHVTVEGATFANK
jgi:evolved beta-galactosidase subunit beta